MSRVMSGRFTAEIDGPVVAFIIGMRVNRLWAVHKWLPTFLAMGPMLSTLFRHPEKGFLGGQTIFYWRGVGLIQYWRSFDDLERFAKNPGDPHLPAWKRFNRSVGSGGTVGIWHETYLVEPGQVEAIYVNMPVFGLAKATRHAAAAGRRAAARERLG